MTHVDLYLLDNEATCVHVYMCTCTAYPMGGGGGGGPSMEICRTSTSHE